MNAMTRRAPLRRTAAALIVGDELLNGWRADSHLMKIAAVVADCGIALAEVRFLRDDRDAISRALNELRAQADFVIVTGGLGPTHDDVTLEGVAHAFGAPLVERPDLLAEIERRWNCTLDPYTRRIVCLPKGSEAIPCALGGQPGFRLGNVVVLPGVPSSAHAMLNGLADWFGRAPPLASATIRVAGVYESVFAASVASVAKAHPSVSIGSYPDVAGGELYAELVVSGADQSEVKTSAADLVDALLGRGLAPVVATAEV